MNRSVLDQLCYSTVRIECENSLGQKSTGTGFFFSYEFKEKNPVLVIITNKHVLQGMTNGRFIMTAATEAGEPINTLHYPITVSDIQHYIHQHPAADVDLCALPFEPVLKAAEKQGIRLFYRSLNKHFIPSRQQLEALHVLEDILMIGYPNGIWDKHNNMPILRRGSTATHPNLDYEGRKEFLIDAACFPGSSGSPVLIYNPVGYMSSAASQALPTPRTLLMGVLYAASQYTPAGEIPAHPGQQPLHALRIHNNLGLVIKSDRILELQSFFS